MSAVLAVSACVRVADVECDADSECPGGVCNDGLCVPNECPDGACPAGDAPIGAGCAADVECASGLCGGDDRCVRNDCSATVSCPDGEACFGDDECGRSCVRAGPAFEGETCVSFIEDELCQGYSAPCAAGLECDVTGGAGFDLGTCIVPRERGAPCNIGSALGGGDDGCVDGLSCVDDETGFFDGVCIRATPAAVGVECLVDAECESAFCATDDDKRRRCVANECPTGAGCDVSESCVAFEECGTQCLAPVAEGGECDHGGKRSICTPIDAPCEAGLECTVTNPSGDEYFMTCVTPSDAGGPCDYTGDAAHDGCVEGLTCDPSTSTCT